MCRDFTQLCKALELFGGELVAIDGSKFLAVNSRSRNFSRAKLARALDDLEEKIARYLTELDQQDEHEPDLPAVTADALKVKIAHLRRRQEH